MVTMASGIARDGGDGGDGIAQHGGQTPNISDLQPWFTMYLLDIGYPCSMLCSIDTCQFKVSADQYFAAISQAQVGSSSRSRVFWKLTADQVLVFLLDRGLMTG